VDPLSPDYPWYTPYQFAGNMPIWAIDLDGLEQLTSQQKQRIEQLADPALGNHVTVVVSDAAQANPPGVQRALVPKVVHGNTGRAVSYTTYTPGGLEAGPVLVLPDYHREFRKEDVTINALPFRHAVAKRAGENAQANFRRSNVELASTFGPSFATFLAGVKFVDKSKTAVKYSDEVVEFTQGTGEKALKIIAQIPAGFKRLKERIKKQKIFSNGKTYISPDADGHNGGVWKAAKSIEDLGSKETRLGTFGADMKKIGD
jgi:hypothetical protein